MQPEPRKTRADLHNNKAQMSKRDFDRKNGTHSFSEKRKNSVLSKREKEKREENIYAVHKILDVFSGQGFRSIDTIISHKGKVTTCHYCLFPLKE